MAATVSAADLFCGGGGTSTGLAFACQDLGVKVRLLAVDHWETAVATHSRNHPWAEHRLASVDSLDPIEAVPSGRLDLLLASPECRYFSRAAGNRRLQPQKRASAWVLLRWLEQLDVRTALVENVPEFVNWCRVGVSGKPVLSEQGDLFRAWVLAVRSLGYTVEWKVLDAADFGACTSRRRLFVQARKGHAATVWPRQTHSRGGKVPGTLPWRGAREVIDLSRPSRSVFGRPLARNTWRRLLEGVERFGSPEMQPFVRMLREQLGIPAQKRGGQAHRPSRAFTLEVAGRRATQIAVSLDEPTPTITTRCDRYVAMPIVLAPEVPAARGGEGYLVRTGFHPPGDRMGALPRSIEEPMPTLTSAGGIELARPFLSRYYGVSPPRSLDEPLPTVTTHDRIALARPVLDGQAFDILMRMLAPDELAAGMGFPKEYHFEGSRSAQVRQIGNAVQVDIARALCRALLSCSPAGPLDSWASVPRGEVAA